MSVSEVRRLEERVREPERLLVRKTMVDKILKGVLERSRERNRPCSVHRQSKDVTRGVGLSPARPSAGKRQAASVLSKGAGRGASASNSQLGGYATDLRLPPHHGTAETRACQGQPTPCQPQARLSDHEAQRPVAGTPQHSASRPAPRRQCDGDALQPALVLGRPGVAVLERGDHADRLRDRCV